MCNVLRNSESSQLGNVYLMKDWESKGGCEGSFPASGSFLRSQFFASGGQSIGVSASASVLPMNTQD